VKRLSLFVFVVLVFPLLYLLNQAFKWWPARRDKDGV
jgi:hypothetical protein